MLEADLIIVELTSKDLVPNCSRVVSSITTVSGVLPIALVVTADEPLTIGLCRRIPIVARSLRIVVLVILSIARAGVYALLVTTANFLIVIATVSVATISVATVSVATVSVVSIVSVATVSIGAIIPVAAISIGARVLLIPFIVALHKAITKSLR